MTFLKEWTYLTNWGDLSGMLDKHGKLKLKEVRMKTEKWRDGTSMVCSKCGRLIFKGQPFNATISQLPKKRECSHFLCSGGTITVIGSPKPGVIEATQYGGKHS